MSTESSPENPTGGGSDHIPTSSTPKAGTSTPVEPSTNSTTSTVASSGSIDDPSMPDVVSTVLNPSLVKLKLLDCIRNEDTARLDSIVAEVKSKDADNENLDKLLRLLLHYAVQVGPLSMSHHIVENKLIDDINYQDDDGNTPLHLAAMSARNDIIEYLMGFPEINDCLVNKDLKQAIECSSNMDIVQLMSDLRTKYVEVEASKLRRGFETRDFAMLESVLSSARARELLDINGTDPLTGDTVLLEFVKKNDTEMVQFILKHGGDPFKRSVNGRLPIDCASSLEMRSILRRACNSQTVIDSANDHPQVGPPTCKGFLKKWTNFAGGYKLRWFVLDEEGRLSYYKSPSDMQTCRGMVHVERAQVRMDSSEKCRFELIIPPQTTGSPVRWHLRANHQIESNRWVWTLQNAIRYARDQEKKTSHRRAINVSTSSISNPEKQYASGISPQLPSNRDRQAPSSAGHRTSPQQLAKQHRRGPSSSSPPEEENALSSPVKTTSRGSTATVSSSLTPPHEVQQESHHVRSSSRSSLASTSSQKSTVSSIGRVAKKLYKKPAHAFNRVTRRKKSHRSYCDEYDNSSMEDSGLEESDVEAAIIQGDEFDEEQTVDEDLANLVVRQRRPDNKDLIIARNQIKIELSSFSEFLENAATDPTVSKQQVVSVSRDILNNLDQLYSKEGEIMESKEARLEKMFERQHEISTIWESSIRQLELEIDDRQKKICDLEDTMKSVRKSLKASVIIPAVVEAPKTKEKEEIPERLSISVTRDEPLTRFLTQTDDSDDEFFDAEGEEEELESEQAEQLKELEGASDEASIETETETISTDEEFAEHVDSAGIDEVLGTDPEKSDVPTVVSPEGGATAPEAETIKSVDTSEIKPAETVAVATLARDVVEPFQPTVNDGKTIVNNQVLESETQKQRYSTIVRENTFHGYEDPLRTTLAPEDNRPKISLWGVLKSLVGKDMTKMTLPVSFNEPTSLLQRNVEVIEYSDLLDRAATIQSSPLRMVYVACFAASEYASTVGRIAKPFNPLLGETFEYARPDKGYRVLVEQVSHHPPISALMAQSPYWSYYGESNVKTKFYGRSFDIKHLGTWFCEVYPSHGTHDRSGRPQDMELYSWKKVNNSVVGIIIGRPTMDNYGEMEIRNHMTGDYMHFNFKARGWRESSAYEVKGEVYSADGKLQYNIGGRWNSKIYAKSATQPKAQKFVVWTAAKRREMMFHLTDFAASLNAPQPHLLPVIACTDTRLRPDQREMEDGEYDKAAEYKNRLEEKQRAAKRERDATGTPYKPSFFVKANHPVTSEEYYKFNDEYWKERDAGELKSYKDIF